MGENASEDLLHKVMDKASGAVQGVVSAGSAVRNDADDAAQKGSDIDAGDVDEGLMDRLG